MYITVGGHKFLHTCVLVHTAECTCLCSIEFMPTFEENKNILAKLTCSHFYLLGLN